MSYRNALTKEFNQVTFSMKSFYSKQALTSCCLKTKNDCLIKFLFSIFTHNSKTKI